jgi:hypothetical protein
MSLKGKCCKKRKQIPKAVKAAVWNIYMGKKAETTCFIGCGTTISWNTFECGHVVADSKGGLPTIDNLRPICASCNQSMEAMDMRKFIADFGFKPKMKIPMPIRKSIPHGIQKKSK